MFSSITIQLSGFKSAPTRCQLNNKSIESRDAECIFQKSQFRNRIFKNLIFKNLNFESAGKSHFENLNFKNNRRLFPKISNLNPMQMLFRKSQIQIPDGAFLEISIPNLQSKNRWRNGHLCYCENLNFNSDRKVFSKISISKSVPTNSQMVFLRYHLPGSGPTHRCHPSS